MNSAVDVSTLNRVTRDPRESRDPTNARELHPDTASSPVPQIHLKLSPGLSSSSSPSLASSQPPSRTTSPPLVGRSPGHLTPQVHGTPPRGTTGDTISMSPPRSPMQGARISMAQSRSPVPTSPVLEARMPSPLLYLALAQPQPELPSSAASPSRLRLTSPGNSPRPSPGVSPTTARRLIDPITPNNSGGTSYLLREHAPIDMVAKSTPTSPFAAFEGTPMQMPGSPPHQKSYLSLGASESMHIDTKATSPRSFRPLQRTSDVSESGSLPERDPDSPTIGNPPDNGVGRVNLTSLGLALGRTTELDMGLGIGRAESLGTPMWDPAREGKNRGSASPPLLQGVIVQSESSIGGAGSRAALISESFEKKDSAVNLSPHVPRFHFPPGTSPLQSDERSRLHTDVSACIEKTFRVPGMLGSERRASKEADLAPLARIMGLPRYMAGALMRFATWAENGTGSPGDKDGVGRKGALRMWELCLPYAHDSAMLSFYLLGSIPTGTASQASRSNATRALRFPSHILPHNLDLVVQDVVRAHPGLEFLANMPIFQARYVDTVVARVWYGKGRGGDERMTLSDWRKSGFLDVLRNLEQEEDVNSTRDPFSYKHFYVIYCRFWELDTDHDMVISGSQLASYDGCRITRRVMRRVVEGYGRRGAPKTAPAGSTPLAETRKVPRAWFTGWKKGDAEASEAIAEDLAAAEGEEGNESEDTWEEAKFEYRDFVWFILSVEDKNTPPAIEYWFRCLDTDGDGMLSLHELKYFYDEQRERMYSGFATFCNEVWSFPDFVCNLLDLAQVSPHRPYLTLADLKRCRNAGLLFNFLFDWRRYDVHVHRMEPSFREQDEVWIAEKKGGAGRVKLIGWDKFAERTYELLAYEEQQQQSAAAAAAAIAAQKAKRQAAQARSVRNGAASAARKVLFDVEGRGARSTRGTSSGNGGHRNGGGGNFNGRYIGSSDSDEDDELESVQVADVGNDEEMIEASDDRMDNSKKKEQSRVEQTNHKGQTSRGSK
ncbi:hypothetical protein M427DRAFT_60803 [Gonapodya prolifera JEL478]|uniref:EF-hand domain-containing protein n=1 Tax=Gonapodya prolifera (strain JEL478) TaxID=1344416 RepID=A0A139A3J0_GONPJ|nr:hypothetical protein M427DRAFT_60803 [Gonapodya prolifera JEL478]|eukprot:KXS11229.1 hypothetical protein M427DRAFT_60803 [Gonapodya prolifera JEL478]